MPEKETQLAALRSGRLDYIGQSGGGQLQVAQVETLQRTNPEIVIYPWAFRSETSLAFNLRHPSLKRAPNERSRIVVWNNWLGSKKVPNQMAVVLAPTGRPEGFSYAKAPEFSRQTLFLGMNVGHTDYRTDPLGTFVEVYGDMIQIAAE